MRCIKCLILLAGFLFSVLFTGYADTEGLAQAPRLDLYPHNTSPMPAVYSLNRAEDSTLKTEWLALASTAGDSQAGLSLDSLGFSSDQTQGNSQDQAQLDKRSRMLQLHQRWGLATTVPLALTVFLAPGDRSNSSQRTLHGSLGVVTAAMYLTTASYAFRAPKIPGTKTKGPIRLHKALVWIHLPGMILTPILGAMADEQRNSGEKVHGIASAHSAVAAITIASYVAAILSVSIKF